MARHHFLDDSRNLVVLPRLRNYALGGGATLCSSVAPSRVLDGITGTWIKSSGVHVELIPRRILISLIPGNFHLLPLFGNGVQRADIMLCRRNGIAHNKKERDKGLGYFFRRGERGEIELAHRTGIRTIASTASIGSKELAPVTVVAIRRQCFSVGVLAPRISLVSILQYNRIVLG